MTRPFNPKAQARSAARLAAVQALYQHAMEGTAATKLMREFQAHRLGSELGDEDTGEARYAEADVDFFNDVVSGAIEQLDTLDSAIEARLAEGWSLKRLDKTMLQILRCGSYELVARNDVPISAVINEYVDVAKAFFDDKDAKFVNGLLDGVARDVRPDSTTS